MLCEVQRRHPAVNITGTADDTYFNGDERVHAAAAAAAAVDARIEESFASLADLAHSPPERRALSRSVASLRIREGGFELAAFSATRTALLVAALARPDTTALSESMPPVLAPPGLLIADSGLAPTEARASTAPGDSPMLDAPPSTISECYQTSAARCSIEGG